MSDKRLPPLGNDAARRAHFIVGDPIRAVAALLIFTFHASLAALVVTGRGFGRASYDEAFGPIGAEIVDNAELGVFAFFALSGYLIGRPFVHAYLRGERGPDLPRYLRRRVLRIAPGFLLVVSLAILRFGSLDASVTDVAGIYALLQAYDLSPSTLTQGVFGHLWTVSAEMGFYLLLPIGVLGVAAVAGPRLGMRGRLALLLALLTAAALASLAFRHAAPHTVGYARWFPSVLFAFIPGVVLAGAEAFAPSVAAARSRLARAAVIVLVAAGIGFCVAFASLGGASPAVLGACAALGVGLIIAASLLRQWSGGGAWRILDNRPLHWLGERSYGFYLIHVPVLWDLQFRLDGRIDNPKVAFLVVFASAFSLTAGLATLSFQYVERPCMQMDRWPWQRRERAPVAPQAGLIAPDATPEPAPAAALASES